MSAGAGVSGTAIDLLVEAGAVLATSLDLPTTMNQVARLTVPRLAEVCVIDLQTQDGSISYAVKMRHSRLLLANPPQSSRGACAKKSACALSHQSHFF